MDTYIISAFLVENQVQDKYMYSLTALPGQCYNLLTDLFSSMQEKGMQMYNKVVKWILLLAKCDQQASCPPALHLGTKTKAQLEALIIIIISQD